MLFSLRGHPYIHGTHSHTHITKQTNKQTKLKTIPKNDSKMMYPDLSLDPVAEKTSLACYIESHMALLIGCLESLGSISQERVLLNITPLFDIICHEGCSPTGFCRMGITLFEIFLQARPSLYCHYFLSPEQSLLFNE